MSSSRLDRISELAEGITKRNMKTQQLASRIKTLLKNHTLPGTAASLHDQLNVVQVLMYVDQAAFDVREQLDDASILMRIELHVLTLADRLKAARESVT